MEKMFGSLEVGIKKKWFSFLNVRGSREELLDVKMPVMKYIKVILFQWQWNREAHYKHYWILQWIQQVEATVYDEKSQVTDIHGWMNQKCIMSLMMFSVEYAVNGRRNSCNNIRLLVFKKRFISTTKTVSKKCLKNLSTQRY